MVRTDDARRDGFRARLAAQAAARKKNIALLKPTYLAKDAGEPTPSQSKESTRGAGASAVKAFRMHPELSDTIVVQREQDAAELPSILKVLLSAVIETDDPAPLCVLLPSTEYVAECLSILAALECLRADFPQTAKEFIDRIDPGTRLRALPEGYVFIAGERCEVLGQQGMFLHYTEKETWQTNGRRFVPNDQLFRYEPTRRKQPISRASIKLANPFLSGVDKLAGVRTLGNTALYRSRVILVGSRAEFERAVASIELRPVKGNGSAFGPLSDHIAWGSFQPSGEPIIVSPSAANGSPLVAIAHDFMGLEKPCLNGSSIAGSQFIITARVDQVLSSLDLANRIGERQRVVLIADCRRRTDIASLRKHGWRVWEPQG